MNQLIEQIRDWFKNKVSPEIVEANVRALRRAAEEVKEG
jgi:Pyruvate/2-oxoacid:ferredoxin oxidoreductase gamma subunit